MGMIWRFAMPLLSTLAALVIIVHSAEEDMEYRRGVRQRMLKTEPNSYEQPWRAMEAEPMIQQQSAARETWNDNSSEEPPRRRRPGRKRKRRPHPVNTDEQLVPQEIYAYPEETPQAYFESDNRNNYQTTEVPRRRRKKIEPRPDHWIDEPLEPDRPLKRRGQRRKRPSLDNWHELSEFGGSQPDETPREVYEETRTEYNEPDRDDNEDHHEHFVEKNTYNDQYVQQTPHGKDDDFQPEENDQAVLTPIDGDDRIQYNPAIIKEDKSLSEFSSEVMSPSQTPRLDDESINMREKMKDKSPGLFEDFDKAKDNGVNSHTLKDILKRSNGTSLSEILQQHNLSLADLLHGKENAISVLTSNKLMENHDIAETLNESKDSGNKHDVKSETQNKEINEGSVLLNLETKYAENPKLDNAVTSQASTTEINISKNNHTEVTTEKESQENKNENLSKIVLNRRFPGSQRRKHRMRPMMNTTLKSQINRGLLTMNAKRYVHYNRRNVTKFRDWKDLVPPIKHNNTVAIIKEESFETSTSPIMNEKVTVISTSENTNASPVDSHAKSDAKLSDIDDIEMETTQSVLITTTDVMESDTVVTVTEKPMVTPAVSTTLNTSGLRRQAFNNRLKKKRLKQKNTTTERTESQDDFMKNLFGMTNLVSSSEFIARTQTPRTILEDRKEYITTLEDFMITDTPVKTESGRRATKKCTKSSTTPIPILTETTTEEIARIEIEEILNDTRTSAQLSKILMERNMTLSELVQHRERGSSYVHLADIFHNASKEPNPPEPFLSKSLIEPISKETYPLRALLDANLHDPNAKVTTDPNQYHGNYVNIPVVMDFGNNVNENAENMGIMSLFNNFTKPTTSKDKIDSKNEFENLPYETTITSINITKNNANDTTRESRVLHEYRDDVVSWNEIFSLIRRNHNNETEDITETNTEGTSPPESIPKIALEDVDGGLIVLEDLQHLKDFDSLSDEKLEVNSYENPETTTPVLGILDKIPSQTKSVTVVTASIAGLAMVLFLLTYFVFKWKQHKTVNRKRRSFCDERIPTPVFENRKGHKHNSSTRSISPMLSSSNIYTLNTLDSRNGKESPEYMWDTLRKPFQ